MKENILTVLVIEDNQDMLQLIGRILGAEGYRVILAADGIYGLDIFRAEEPDLIMLDIGMPNPDGFSILKAIREVSSVPVLVVSAKWEKSTVDQAIALGADGYLKKPFSADELLARVKMRIWNTKGKRLNGEPEPE